MRGVLFCYLLCGAAVSFGTTRASSGRWSCPGAVYDNSDVKYQQIPKSWYLTSELSYTAPGQLHRPEDDRVVPSETVDESERHRALQNPLGQAQFHNYIEHEELPGHEKVEGENFISWCTTSRYEQHKCGNLSQALQRDKALFGKDYIELGCKQAFDSEECMSWVDAGDATLLALDAGEVFIAGRYHSLVPILQEMYDGGYAYEYSVAVVKRGGLAAVRAGEGLHGMRGARACFPLVGTMAGWTLPVHTLMQEGGLKVVDCNNHVKSAIEYFGESCAVNSLSDTYNPIGDNSDKLCKLCAGGAGARCTMLDPFAGYVGALRCLVESGEVAFLRHTTVVRALNEQALFGGVTEEQFELVCKDGSRRPVREWQRCNWGKAPSDALVTSSAKTQDNRQRYQRFVQKLVQIYGEPNRVNFTQQVNYGRDEYGNPLATSNMNRDEYGNPLPGPSAARDEYGNPLPRAGVGRDEFNNPLPGGGVGRDEFGNPLQSSFGRDEFGNAITPSRDEFGKSITASTDRYQFGRNDGFYNRERTSTPGYQPVTDGSGQRIETFRLFESVRYGSADLLLQDATVGFRVLSEERQAAAHILNNPGVGARAEQAAMGVRDCPVRRATLCLTSDAEMDKCVKMRVALKSAFLSPALVCWRGHSARRCERAIAEGVADFTLLDAADMLHAAQHHKLVPFMSEVYASGNTWYYAVAVAKEQDPDTDLTYLRGKNTCHTGISTAAGWVYPLAYLISNGWIRSYGCDGARAASEYFTKSCAPGALSTEYVDSSQGVPHENLCHLCHGTSFRRCRRDASEDYYGHVGALRCMVEGGGDVAFVRHTAPAEVSGGRRREWWARDLLLDDLQLLCPDGTRAKVTEYERCNLGRVPGSVLMGRANHTELDAFSNLMLYAQQLYGAITADDFSFSMFYSEPPYADLIFSSAAVSLRPLAHRERSAELVAGASLPRAARLVSCDAPAAASYIGADPAFLSGAVAVTATAALLLPLAAAAAAAALLRPVA